MAQRLIRSLFQIIKEKKLASKPIKLGIRWYRVTYSQLKILKYTPQRFSHSHHSSLSGDPNAAPVWLRFMQQFITVSCTCNESNSSMKDLHADWLASWGYTIVQASLCLFCERNESNGRGVGGEQCNGYTIVQRTYYGDAVLWQTNRSISHKIQQFSSIVTRQLTIYKFALNKREDNPVMYER